jgi:hypothetical protein
MLPFRFRLQIAATLHGGMTILSATERCTNPLIERPHLQRNDWMQMILPIVSSTLMPKRHLKALNIKIV